MSRGGSRVYFKCGCMFSASSDIIMPCHDHYDEWFSKLRKETDDKE